MLSNFEIIESFYSKLPEKFTKIKELLGRPLTYSEKILYAHLYSQPTRNINPDVDYADFRPDRVIMQDATAQMALLQFIMTGLPRTNVPTSVHCDHLITAESGAFQDLLASKKINKEVYDFLNSVCIKYGIDFWEPGAGIIHQIIFENYAFPGGMIIGTDSHTPTAGGLGMIAIGVGGADAVDVMAGMEWELKFPKIIGIKLTGKLNTWTSPKDIILKIAGILTVDGATGCIIEYFGEGCKMLSATGKGTICNMGAELGATCSIFPYDETMSEYLRATGREKTAILADVIKEHLEPDTEVLMNPEKFYNNFIEIDLDELEPYINGPFSPDIATPISRMRETAIHHNWPTKIEAGLIGSCTNSSYEDLARTASIIQNAVDNNIIPKAPFYVSPGSEQIRLIAERDGIFDVFRKINAEIYANACGPCIGQWNRKNKEKDSVNTVIHSFNRNFSKRIDGNPYTHAFVASPEIVAALTLAGDLCFNPITDALLNKDGNYVKLKPPVGDILPLLGFEKIKNTTQKPVQNNSETNVVISDNSNRIQLLEPFPAWDGNDFTELSLLMKVKGKCTTDHISPAGKWLKYRGHLDNISDNFLSGAVNYFNEQTDKIYNQTTGLYDTVSATAREYKRLNISSVIIGDENYGEGSSREHAAMEARYLNVKAVIVKSFARIHENNLKKQGVLALVFHNLVDYSKISENDKISITGLDSFAAGKMLNVVIAHANGTTEQIQVKHSYSPIQIEWFKAGSALNLIRTQNKIKHE